MEVGKVRSDLTLVMVLLSKVEMLEMGLLGIVVSGKIPKVKERLAAASIWIATWMEKKTLLLNATKLDVRALRSPTWRANCRIVYPTSSSEVYPVVEFRR